jgi:hypothetical protein
MNATKILLLTTLASLSIHSNAYVIGPSNLGLLGYSDHDCSRPYSKPTEPYSFSDQWQIDSYNQEVEEFNAQHESYITCINEYLEAASKDIKRIQEKVEEAIEEANQPFY